MLTGVIFYILFAILLFTLAVLDKKEVGHFPVHRKTKTEMHIKFFSELANGKFPKIIFSNKSVWNNVPYYTGYMFAIVLAFTIVAAIRYQVGPDCESYVNSYFSIIENKEYQLDQSFEPGFKWICHILGFLGIGRVGFLAFWAFIEIVLFTYSLKDRRYLLPFALYVLILCPFFLSWMNGMRQIVVSLAFLLMSVMVIDENRKMLFITVILICSLIHKSSLILLPFVFLTGIGIFKHRLLLLVILTCCVIVGLSSYVNQYFNAFDPVLEVLGYENYSDRMEYYSSIDNEFGIGVRRILLYVLACSSILFSNKIQKTYKDPLYDFSFNLSFIHACLKENLLANAASIFWRPFLYFEVFELITYSYLLSFLFRKSQKNKLLAALLLLLSSIYIIYECYSVRNVEDETSIYKTIFGSMIL